MRESGQTPCNTASFRCPAAGFMYVRVYPPPSIVSSYLSLQSNLAFFHFACQISFFLPLKLFIPIIPLTIMLAKKKNDFREKENTTRQKHVKATLELEGSTNWKLLKTETTRSVSEKILHLSKWEKQLRIDASSVFVFLFKKIGLLWVKEDFFKFATMVLWSCWSKV